MPVHQLLYAVLITYVLTGTRLATQASADIDEHHPAVIVYNPSIFMLYCCLLLCQSSRCVFPLRCLQSESKITL